jgi:hypothetical protein
MDKMNRHVARMGEVRTQLGRRSENDIKIDLKRKRQWKVDSNGYCLEVGSCNLGNKSSGSMKGGKFRVISSMTMNFPSLSLVHCGFQYLLNADEKFQLPI